MRVLVTGGAGFIGSHLIDHLLMCADVEAVMSFDCLVQQVHPESPKWPEYQFALAPDAWKGDAPRAFTRFGDVRDPNAVARTLETFRPDVVIHLAALVGVGQSAEWPAKYVSSNVTGTSVVVEMVARYNEQAAFRVAAMADLARPVEERLASLDLPEGSTTEEGIAALNEFDAGLLAQVQGLPDRPIRTVVIAGSMSSYGEGGDQPVTEDRALAPASVYAWTKAAQEQIARTIAGAHDLDIRIARFFNVIGPRQSLTNPYTGIGAIFAARALVGKAARVYEDGQQARDFINVIDVVTAIKAIVDHGDAGQAYNVCTGQPTTVLDLAGLIRTALGGPEPEVTGLYRSGDVRRCVGDNTRLRSLGWHPFYTIENTVEQLAAWVRSQPEDARRRIIETTDSAHEELLASGLLVQTAGGEA
jgi:dTDP-L-rhamnose 4-epimerase